MALIPDLDSNPAYSTFQNILALLETLKFDQELILILKKETNKVSMVTI